MSNYDDAYAVALDATLAAVIAGLFSDDMSDALAELVHDEVRNNSHADDSMTYEVLEAAARAVSNMTPEAMGALVTKRMAERRAKHQAFLAKNGLDFGSMARAIVGAGK